MAAEHVAYYIRDIPGYYDRIASNAGFENDVEAVRTADSLSEAGEAISEDFINTVAIADEPEAARKRLSELLSRVLIT